jgi:hypothetical protein
MAEIHGFVYFKSTGATKFVSIGLKKIAFAIELYKIQVELLICAYKPGLESERLSLNFIQQRRNPRSKWSLSAGYKRLEKNTLLEKIGQ